MVEIKSVECSSIESIENNSIDTANLNKNSIGLTV